MFTPVKPNVAVEWVAILLRVEEVSDSRPAILRIFRDFLNPFRQLLRYYNKLGHDHFSLHIFQLIIH
jgi:hypothetical protein